MALSLIERSHEERCYVSATREWVQRRGNPDDWRRYWQDPGTRYVAFIAKDNVVFHCIVFPAMLAWQAREGEGFLGPREGEEYVLPENVPANEFFNLEGRKFSKSEGWYLDLDDFVGKDGADRTRFYLISAMPETADSDFLRREFKGKTHLLANQFGNFAVRVLKFVAQHFGGRVPAATRGYEGSSASQARPHRTGPQGEPRP